MKIAVLSDIHENFNNLLRALDMIRELGAEKILCLGDFMNPGIAKELARCGIPVFSIWGNNDGDQVTITKIALQEGSGLEIGDKTYAVIELDSRQIFMTHYPDLVKPAALSGITAAFVVAISRAVGETMIVAIAAGAGPNLTLNPFEAAEAMTGYMVRISGGDLSYDSVDYQSIFAVGLMVFAMTMLLNIASQRIVSRFREAYE